MCGAAAASAVAEHSTTWMPRMKASTESPAVCRAVPPVGSTWLESGQVVAQRDGGIRADEHGAGVADPRREAGRIGCLDLQVLGRPDIRDRERGGGVVHQHAGGLPGQRGLHRVPVPCGGDLGAQFRLGALGDAGVGGDEQAGGQRAVLGLGDEVGGEEPRVGGVVGDDRDLGRARLGVHPDGPGQQPLGGGHVGVAWAGDHIHRGAVGGAVGEHGDRLGAADRVHLLDAEQRAGGQDGRCGQAAVVRAGRGGDGDPADAGDLRRDHIHDHRGGQRYQAGRYVHPGPVHRDVPLGDLRAIADPGDMVGGPLRLVHGPHPARHLLQRGPEPRVEGGEGIGERLRRYPAGGQVDPVETGGVLPYRGRPAVPHVFADRPDPLHGGPGVQRRARQHAGEFLPGHGDRWLPAKIDD